jgi:hypothetical protein
MASARQDVQEEEEDEVRVDTEKIKEQIKKELVAKMQMQNMHM